MRYSLAVEDPAAHAFAVSLEIDEPDPSGQRLRMPAWTPGSYMIRDFARHVVRLEAVDGSGNRVDTIKLDKDTWHCAPCSGPLRVSCRVHARDPSVRAAYLDHRGGFCNGTSVFLQPLDQPNGPFELTLPRPRSSPETADWSAVTAMEPVEIDAHGFGRYHAADYEELVDHPLMFGDLGAFDFTVANVVHRVVLSDRPQLDGERLCRDLADICSQQVRIFGELPAPRYIFMMHVVAAGFGGLEHRGSTVLAVARDSLPLPGDGPRRPRYQELLGLCSHEYFHLWHVKRIRPAALVPIDFSREAHTTLLWAFEGMTSYYDDLVLCRAGVISTRQWLDRIERTMTRVHRGGGRHLQTVSESSFDAWTRFYKADENAPNAIVSYYAKGSLIALVLDLHIRQGTGGTRSLDDVMRALWERHGRTGDGVAEDGVERLVAEVTGLDLTPFFEAALRSTADIDLAGPLAAFGVELSWRPAAAEPGFSPQLGATLSDDRGMPRLGQVLAGRPARQAGLAPGDRVVAVDGVHVTAGALADHLARLPVGVNLEVHVLRDDRLLCRVLRLVDPPPEQCRLQLVEDDATAAARRAAWLGAVT